MAALFDTTVAVLLLRRRTPVSAADLIRAARAEIAGGGALLPAVATSELVIGERTREGVRRLHDMLGRLPVVILSKDVAADAGSMGSYLQNVGASIPFPDLLVAATAVWLDVPLLAWDGDYARSRKLAADSTDDHAGAALWRRLQLHASSLDA